MRYCPICNKKLRLLKYRGRFYNFLFCPSCILTINMDYKKQKYNDDYFSREYEKHYGTIYIADKKNIDKLNIKRLERIKKYLQYSYNKVRLIELGSSTGFFLNIAKNFFTVQGIEISEFAVKKAKELFDIDIQKGDFNNMEFESNYDVVTAFYTLEHSIEFFNIFRRLYKALNSGGILAFSIPSLNGPFFRLRRHEWLASHPDDHYADLSEHAIKKLLKKNGFKKIKIYHNAIHYDRFPIIFRNRLFINIFSMYDTMEVIAIKK